jgi:hypothetical protein
MGCGWNFCDADRVWFGVASVPMVGIHGCGLVTRARQVAWTAGAAAGITVGAIGLIVAAMPSLWVSLFTSDPGVRRSVLFSRRPGILRLNGRDLYFLASAAKVGGLVAGTAGLLLVAAAAGGWPRGACGHCPRWWRSHGRLWPGTRCRSPNPLGQVIGSTNLIRRCTI